ncbi:MAG: DUF3341 domain-containing protein [Saprospiraceae bacterium]
MAHKNLNVVYGVYDDEEIMINAVAKAKKEHLEIMDVYSPFPLHGLDPVLGLEESRLHIAGFIFGALGTLTAFLGMTWIFTKDWPIIFGGKPFWSIPAFIPITFELTILFSAIGMVVTFYTVCGLGPGVTNAYLDDRITDDKFVIAFNKSEIDTSAVETFLSNSGASEINHKTI